MDKTVRHQEILASLEKNCADLPLCEVPTDMVIGNGNLDSEVMFIGEAPGAEEAKQRIPFVGRAGQLLNRTLTECGMKREDYYISNIVKVRPPNNRDPLPEEINAYLPYLLEEIELIQPKLFVSLGRFSMNFFLPEAKITAIHGKLQRFWWQDRITYLLPVYHPAAALRSTKMLEAFKNDVAKIPKALAYITQQQEHDQQLQQVKESLF